MTHISGIVTTTSRVPVLLKSFLFRNTYTLHCLSYQRAQVSPSFPRSEISMVRLGTNSASVRIHHRL